MSAIFGIIDFHDRPLDPSRIRSMQNNMHHRGPDGSGMMEGENWAFGHGLLKITPSPFNEKQPLQIGDHIITADARLDQREEIMDRLSIRDPESDQVTYPELLLRSFQAFGPDFVKNIYGDFALAIWDTRKKELFIARDHVGSKPLLYSFEDGRFVFSTEMKAIVQLPFIETSVNEEFIKIHSTGYSTGHGTTAWEGVERLAPATYLKVSASGIDEIHYWRPKYSRMGVGGWGLEKDGENKRFNDSTIQQQKGERREERDIAMQFRQLMEQAVVDRCRGVDVVGIPLSGGFDSSSIVALAASALKGTNTRIVTISSVLSRRMEGGGGRLVEENKRFNDSTIQQQEGERERGREEGELHRKLKDERKYIDALLAMYPEIEAHYITPDNLSFTGTLAENMEKHYSPENYFYYLDDAINAKFQELGVKRILSGYVGDTTVSNWGIDPVPYLIRQGRFGAAVRVLKGRVSEGGRERKREGESERGFGGRFLKELIKAYAPGSLLLHYHLWKDKEPWGFEKLPVNWTKEEREFLLDYSKKYFIDFTLNKGPVEDQIWDMDTVHFTESFNTGPAHYGVEWAFPWVDRRIIEFLMELPLEHFEIGGRKRGLIRSAMEGLLPEEILTRSDKQDYSPGYPLIFRREFDQITSKFENWSQTGLFGEWVDYLDVQRILDQWYSQEKKLTFDYQLFFIKNLFVFLNFVDKYKNKARTK